MPRIFLMNLCSDHNMHRWEKNISAELAELAEDCLWLSVPAIELRVGVKINVDILFSLDVHCALKVYSSRISWQVPIGEEECVPLQNLCKFHYEYDTRGLEVRKFNTNSKLPTHWQKSFSRNNKNFHWGHLVYPLCLQTHCQSARLATRPIDRLS